MTIHSYQIWANGPFATIFAGICTREALVASLTRETGSCNISGCCLNETSFSYSPGIVDRRYLIIGHVAKDVEAVWCLKLTAITSIFKHIVAIRGIV